MNIWVQVKSISSPICVLVLPTLEKTYTPWEPRYQLSFELARFKFVYQTSMWSSLLGRAWKFADGLNMFFQAWTSIYPIWMWLVGNMFSNVFALLQFPYPAAMLQFARPSPDA